LASWTGQIFISAVPTGYSLVIYLVSFHPVRKSEGWCRGGADAGKLEDPVGFGVLETGDDDCPSSEILRQAAA
jgi:hypothetical protein